MDMSFPWTISYFFRTSIVRLDIKKMTHLIHIVIITEPKATNIPPSNYSCMFNCGASVQAKSMSKQTIKLTKLVITFKLLWMVTCVVHPKHVHIYYYPGKQFF